MGASKAVFLSRQQAQGTAQQAGRSAVQARETAQPPSGSPVTSVVGAAAASALGLAALRGSACWVPWLLARLPMPEADAPVGAAWWLCRPQVTFGPAPEELMLDTSQVASWLFCRKPVT